MGRRRRKNKPKGKFGDMFRIKKEKYGCAAILCLCCDKCYIINMRVVEVDAWFGKDVEGGLE